MQNLKNLSFNTDDNANFANFLSARRAAAAEAAYQEYDFGLGVEVEGDGGWEYTSSDSNLNFGNEWVCPVFVKNDSGNGIEASTRLVFTVNFKPGKASFSEVYARDEKGNTWGNFEKNTEKSTKLPPELQAFLQSKGWVSYESPTFPEHLLLLFNPNYPSQGLILPVDENLPDYEDAVRAVFSKLAVLESKSVDLPIQQESAFGSVVTAAAPLHQGFDQDRLAELTELNAFHAKKNSLNEGSLADFLARQIEDGQIELGEIPHLMARYAFALPDVIIAEMIERMQMASDTDSGSPDNSSFTADRP